MSITCDGASGDAAEVGHAERDGRSLADLSEFGFGTGVADMELFDFAEPALAFGFLDACVEVVDDLDEAGSLVGSGCSMEQRTQASLNLGPVRPEAFDLQLSETEPVVPEASQRDVPESASRSLPPQYCDFA
ncbi:hypothetical protein ACIRD9_41660 [Streptomyces violaceus]|uniref:hypothetical protein n=1 Tax=Streptomyces violaceus TaxID=1936 RepID=UPI00380C12BA